MTSRLRLGSRASQWLLATVVVASGLAAYGATTSLPPRVDGVHLFVTSYNVSNYGTYSVSDEDAPTISPDHRQPPAYPYLLFLYARLFPETSDQPLDCWLTEGSECEHLQRLLKLPNVALHALTALLSGLLLARLGVRPPWQVAGAALVGLSTIGLSYVDAHYSEPLAMLATALLGSLLAEVDRRGRPLHAALAGVATALLILSKPIHLPLAVAVPALIWSMRRREDRRRALVGALACFLLVALPVGGWAARNVFTLDVDHPWSLVSNDNRVIQVRMSHLQMRADEVFGGFVYWTGWRIGPAAAESLLPERAYARFDRELPRSFYQTSRDIDRTTATPANLLRSGASQYLLTPLFLWQVSAPAAQFEPQLLPGNVETAWLVASELVSRLLIIGLAGASWVAWRRRCAIAGMLVGIAWFSLLIHAFLTHSLPRYSVTVFPIMVVMAVWFADALRGRRERPATLERRDGAPVEAVAPSSPGRSIRWWMRLVSKSDATTPLTHTRIYQTGPPARWR